MKTYQDICKKLDLNTLQNADLRGADLRGADLRDADLRCADLRGVDLRGVDLRDSNLRRVDLRGAYLRCANLRGAYLRCANLRGADLEDADLEDAYLEGVDLRDANLRVVDLRYAYLKDAKLNVIWDDFKLVLIPNLSEINNLYIALRDGKINGSTYTGDCCCLSGTLAQSRNDYVGELSLPKEIKLTRDERRPIEQFFYRINPGDTIDNSWDCQQVFKQMKLILKELMPVLDKNFISTLDKKLIK